MPKHSLNAPITLKNIAQCVFCKAIMIVGYVARYKGEPMRLAHQFGDCKKEEVKTPEPAPVSEGNHASEVKPPDKLAGFLDVIYAEVRSRLDLEGTLKAEVSADEIAFAVNQAIENIPTRKVEITTINPGKTVTTNPTDHVQLPYVYGVAREKLHVHLYDSPKGGPGSGKSTMAHRLSELLSESLERTIPFYTFCFTPVTTESKVAGYMDATGNYVMSLFYKAFKNGGVLFLDEMGFAPAYIAGFINPALSNGWCAFPNNEMVYQHKDFYWVSACQTPLNGGGAKYSERRATDPALRSRLTMVAIDYDDSIEDSRAVSLATSRGVDETQAKNWVKWMRKTRAILKENGCHHADTRSTYNGACLLSLLKSGLMSQETLVDCVVFKGSVDVDTRNKVLTQNPFNF